jgi:hypothetical protein
VSQLESNVDWTVSTQRVLVRHDLVAVPGHGAVPGSAVSGGAGPDTATGTGAELATVVANIAYYGYALSAAAFAALRELDRQTLVDWWMELEPVLAVLTGADRKLDDFVVYRNFPAEVLEMSAADYWLRQILMY